MFLFFGGDQRKYPVLKLYSFHNSPLLAIHVHSFPFITLIYLSLLFPCLLLSCNSLNFFPSPPFPYAPFLSFPFPIFPYPFLSSPLLSLSFCSPFPSFLVVPSSPHFHCIPFLSFPLPSSLFPSLRPLISSPSCPSPSFHSFHFLMLPFPVPFILCVFLALLSFMLYPWLLFVYVPFLCVRSFLSLSAHLLSFLSYFFNYFNFVLVLLLRFLSCPTCPLNIMSIPSFHFLPLCFLSYSLLPVRSFPFPSHPVLYIPFLFPFLSSPSPLRFCLSCPFLPCISFPIGFHACLPFPVPIMPLPFPLLPLCSPKR